MRRLVVTIGLAAALALTGCGGGGDDDAAPAPTTAAPSTTALIGNDQAGTPFCGLARTYTERFSTLLTVANDPAKLRVATTDAESAIRQAQAQAPAEIKADVTKVANTAKEVLAGLQKNNFDLSRTSEVSKLQEPAFQTSLASLNRYARAHCGVA
ncbi:MAG TPA: hypothetical protein VNT52_12065 [Acidimicrobiales bacterium]|nr:hypothetical protein [Acidimicrobiales bacterium]